MSTKDPVFKFFRQFNVEPTPSWLGSRSNLTTFDAARNFAGHRLQDKLVREIGQTALLPIKEILECGEMFERVRKKVRAETIVDLCCGHGLLGILFAVFEKTVGNVLLIDRQQPPSHLKLLECAIQIAPWIRPKVTYLERSVEPTMDALPKGAGFVAAHACGTLTDHCLEVAIRHRAPVAVMPCCYPKRACPAPSSLQRALGLETAFDIARTYRLEDADYTTHWTGIPSVITPMNRILIARPEATPSSAP